MVEEYNKTKTARSSELYVELHENSLINNALRVF